MPTNNVFAPKQQRSQDTQAKLLNALHVCLQTKFFEHINIKELAEHAGVSVGTFYRRFKNKESLLPLLYQDFGNDLSNWVDSLEQKTYATLQDAVTQLSIETCAFLQQKKSVFRTLHLNSRLHSEILASDETVDRSVIYQKLSAILLRFDTEITSKNPKRSADMVIYTLISSLLDKVLYPTLTPAVACPHTAEDYSHELPNMLLAYLHSAG